MIGKKNKFLNIFIAGKKQVETLKSTFLNFRQVSSVHERTPFPTKPLKGTNPEQTEFVKIKPKKLE
jgi:hypothetical protein